MTFSGSLSRPKFSLCRAFIFCTLGLAASVQIGVQHFQPKTCLDLNLKAYVLCGAIYLAGALIYIAKYPESTQKGPRFDILGASH